SIENEIYVTFLFKWHKFLILFDTKYKYLIAKKTVQNNYGIFLGLILKRSVHKIVPLWTLSFFTLFFKKSTHFMFINP
ncbi:hypothetical protein CUS72_12530, partial [Enterococcus faecium]